MLEQSEKQEHESKELEKIRKQEEELAFILHQNHIEKLEHESMIRRVCSESEELRELEQKLKVRVVNLFSRTRNADAMSHRNRHQRRHHNNIVPLKPFTPADICSVLQ